MRALSRRPARTLAVAAAVAVVTTTGVALAPGASAYYGSEASVKAALLTTPKIASASGWTGAISGAVTKEGTKDYLNTVTTTYTDAQVAPEGVELVVSANGSDRDENFTSIRSQLSDVATSVSTDTSSAYTARIHNDVSGSDPANYETVGIRKAGSDGLVIAGCVATESTTTTPAQGATCANAVGSAQAAVWAKISPTLVWKSTSAVKAKVLTPASARKAVKIKKSTKTKTKIISTKRSADAQGGRQVERLFKTTSSKSVGFSAPALASITQYGNRTNAGVAFAASKAADKKSLGKLYDVSATRYTGILTLTISRHKVHIAVTVALSGDTIVAGGCNSSPTKVPSKKAVRTCAKRMAAAQVKKSKPLFSSIK